MKEAGLQEQLTASDGHIYQLGFLISQGVNTNGHFFINRKWLDRLGLPVPGTVEELTETLRRFRKEDPNGNGQQDEIPLEFTFDDNTTGVYNLFSFFGLPLNEDYVYADRTGRVHFAPEEDAFFETLAWLHQMYQEGLLDIDFISQGSSIWAAKVNEGNTGLFSYWRLQNTALLPDVAADYEIMLPVHAEGTAACLPRNMDIIEFGAALTADNRDIEASLRWLDAQFETETMLVSQNGRVGDTLTKREDGRYEVRYVPPDNELYLSVPVICGQFFAPADYYASVYVPAAHRQEKAAYCRLYESAGVLEPVSCKILTTVAPKTTAQSAETVRLKARLKSLVDAEIVAMVTRGVTEEGRTAFLQKLRESGSEAYAAVYPADLPTAGRNKQKQPAPGRGRPESGGGFPAAAKKHMPPPPGGGPSGSAAGNPPPRGGACDQKEPDLCLHPIRAVVSRRGAAALFQHHRISVCPPQRRSPAGDHRTPDQPAVPDRRPARKLSVRHAEHGGGDRSEPGYRLFPL